jgi:hypothetical protein
VDNIHDATIPTGSTSTYSIPGCWDPDSGGCHLIVLSTPPFGSLDTASFLYTFNPASGNEGSYTVSFAVSDGSNSTSYSFILTVVTGWSPPPAN